MNFYFAINYKHEAKANDYQTKKERKNTRRTGVLRSMVGFVLVNLGEGAGKTDKKDRKAASKTGKESRSFANTVLVGP